MSLGLVGALAGAIFIILFKQLRKVMQPLNKHLIVRGSIGGLGLGSAGALLPLTLFSGEERCISIAVLIGFMMGVVSTVSLGQLDDLLPCCLASRDTKRSKREPFAKCGKRAGDRSGAHVVLTELSNKMYDQLTHTETIELIVIDRAYRAEPEVFATTRKAVHDAQRQA